MSNLLPVPFRSQLIDGYCLPACVEMVLAFYKRSFSQKQLAQLFDSEPMFGTPFSRITRLNKSGIVVDAGKHATWNDVRVIIASRQPYIAAVDLFFMPYAQVDSRHVVVVVGFDATSAFILDPAESSEVLEVAQDGFIAAWFEMECSYAVIRPH